MIIIFLIIICLIVFNCCAVMKWGKSCKTARNIFADYIYNSSIHGLKYTAERNRPAAEGIFWIFVVIISIYGSCKMISNTWKKWNETPIVVTFNEMELPVWKIPFPALTICPETKTRSSQFNFTKAIHKVWDKSQDALTIDEKRNLNAMLQVCDNFYSEDIDMSYESDSHISEVLSKLSIKKNESLLTCSWGKSFANKDPNCDNFKEILTEEGVCFTFNSLDITELYKEGSTSLQINKDQSIQLSQWSLDDGYDEDAGIDAYPDRVLGSGLRSGVKILMYQDKRNFDYLCRGAIQGFKVILHPPNEVAQVSSQYIRIPPDMDVTIEVSPEMILTSDELKNYAQKRRQCYFEKERDLQYFNVYTQSSCELECLTNYTINKCGCAKFSMPRSPDIRVCDSSDVQCYVKAEKDLLLSEANVDAEHDDEDGIGCNCLPTCTSLTYSSSISQADYYNSRALQRKDLNSEFSMSRITIFFKENQFLPSKRSEVFGMADFLSNCGGLLGLFMGISVISLTEIFYFMTIRVAPS